MRPFDFSKQDSWEGMSVLEVSCVSFAGRGLTGFLRASSWIRCSFPLPAFEGRAVLHAEQSWRDLPLEPVSDAAGATGEQKRCAAYVPREFWI